MTALKIKVSKIQANAVPIVAWRTGRFFVRVDVNDSTETTAIAIASSGWVSWDEELHFDLTRTSTMRLTLLAAHRVRSETMVGWIEERIDAGMRSSGSVERRLAHQPAASNTHIHFKVELLPPDSRSASERRAAELRRREIHDIGAGIHVAMRAVLCPVHLPGAELQAKNAVWFDAENVADTPAAEILDLGSINAIWEPLDLLLKHLAVFTNLIGRFSEIHPYAKFACSVLTMAQKVVIAQRELDNQFRKLIKVTSEVFAFLSELKVAALEGHRQTIKLLTLQTIECAYFIRDYTKQKSFIVRAGNSIISRSAMHGKIEEYEKKFQELKSAFRDGSAMNTEIAVLRIGEQVNRIVTAVELDDLPYASGARFNLGKQCLLGTREELLEEIFEWVNKNDADAPRVLVLNGGPGTGKSAVAHTVSRKFNELRRLGSSFFFAAQDPERSAEKLFSTIARDLADLDPEWREALKQVVSPRALRRTACIQEQFEEFILRPASRPSVYFGPVVIVIDGLDAVGDPEARKTLISLLSSRTAELRSNFRILVTARPDADICRAFKEREGIEWWPISKLVDDGSNLKDIAAFFSSELSGVSGLKWGDRACKRLVRKSEGNFGWAASSCAFIKHIGGRQSPSERMSRLLSNPKETSASELEAEESDSDTDDFFHGRIHDKVHIHVPHIRSKHQLWHPHAPPPKYSEVVSVGHTFPVPLFPPAPALRLITGCISDVEYAGDRFYGEPQPT